MFAQMAREDLKRLRACGCHPTDEQIIRLNDIAVRIEHGKDVTLANMPRVSRAGNVTLYEPTIGGLQWWHDFGRDASVSPDGKLLTYYFMLAHCRDCDYLSTLTDDKKINAAVKSWSCKISATDAELWRSLMWVKTGTDAELPEMAKNDTSADEDASMDRLWVAVLATAGALGITPDSLRVHTPSTLNGLLVQANLHARIPMKSSVAKDYIAYQQVYREIETTCKP